MRSVCCCLARRGTNGSSCRDDSTVKRGWMAAGCSVGNRGCAGPCLPSGQVRLQVHITSIGYALVEKGVLRPVDQNPMNPMCEVPKFLRDNREAIIRALEGAAAR